MIKGFLLLIIFMYKLKAISFIEIQGLEIIICINNQKATPCLIIFISKPILDEFHKGKLTKSSRSEFPQVKASQLAKTSSDNRIITQSSYKENPSVITYRIQKEKDLDFSNTSLMRLAS